MPDLPRVLLPFRDHTVSRALFVDFDGTVAPIVPDPASARPLAGVPKVLGRLAQRLDVVAVVSGRPATFLRDMLGSIRGVRLVGLYGLETVDGAGVVRPAPAAEPWRAVVAEVTRMARTNAPGGLEVEEKGLSVTLHWRSRPSAAEWGQAFAAREGARTGLILQPGRMAVELRPPLDTDKGVVVRQLAEHAGAVAYFGDDLGDLPAFDALTTLARSGAYAVRVAVVDSESPPEVVEAADVVVTGPAGALELLEAMAVGD